MLTFRFYMHTYVCIESTFYYLNYMKTLRGLESKKDLFVGYFTHTVPLRGEMEAGLVGSHVRF